MGGGHFGSAGVRKGLSGQRTEESDGLSHADTWVRAEGRARPVSTHVRVR